MRVYDTAFPNNVLSHLETAFFCSLKGPGSISFQSWMVCNFLPSKAFALMVRRVPITSSSENEKSASVMAPFRAVKLIEICKHANTSVSAAQSY